MGLEQEDDLLPAAKVMGVLVGVLAISLACVFLSWRLLQARIPTPLTLPSRSLPSLLEPPLAPEAPSRTVKYSWADQAQGLVKIPIEKAMEVVIESD